MSDTIRAFIAINFNSKIQRSVKNIQDQLKKTGCNAKWVGPENIHMTLKFLGDVDSKKIDGIKQAIVNLFKNIKPFTVELTQLGFFPNINRPRTLWVGLKDDGQQLNKMAVLIKKALVKIGFREDQRSFSPHITIGRIRSSENIKVLPRSILEYRIPEGLTQTTSNVILYKSTLTSEGPVYEPLYQIKLKK